MMRVVSRFDHSSFVKFLARPLDVAGPGAKRLGFRLALAQLAIVGFAVAVFLVRAHDESMGFWAKAGLGASLVNVALCLGMVRLHMTRRAR